MYQRPTTAGGQSTLFRPYNPYLKQDIYSLCGALGALAVFDLTCKQSLHNLTMWLEEVRSKAAANVQIVLIGAKDDLLEDRQVTTTEAQAFADTEDIEYIETSALSGHNVAEAFDRLLKKVVAKGLMGASQTSISLSSEQNKRKHTCKC